jgi:hypothetical protein
MHLRLASAAIVVLCLPDVSGIRVDLLPALPALGGLWSVTPADRSASATLGMSLEPIPDGLERLTVRFPRFRIDPSTEPPSKWATGAPAELTALENIMSGSRLTIAIETEGPLLRTNSPFREGNRVTLLAADVAQALFSREVQRMAATPGAFDELLAWFSTVPGVTLAPDRDITLDFPNPTTPQGRPAPAPPGSQSSMDTDVFLSRLIGAGVTLTVGPPRNVSSSPGYDNQPSFGPDGNQLFFASARGATPPARDASPQSQSSLPRTDVYRYEISSRRLFRITETPESEFSPTVMPDGVHLSMIRVETDGTQHLCSVEPATIPKRETSLLLADVKPVGYHVWIDAKNVALFVLGDSGKPSTLQIASIEDGRTRTIATDIGRSLQRMPSGSISFVQRETAVDGSVTAVVKALDVATLETRTLVRPPARITDPYVAWMPDGTALSAAGSTIYRWSAGESGWAVVADLEGFGLHDVTRLAVSPNGEWLAIVAQK